MHNKHAFSPGVLIIVMFHNTKSYEILIYDTDKKLDIYIFS